MRAIVIGIALTLVTACAGPTESRSGVNGSWRGASSGAQIRVELRQVGLLVTGTGTVTGFGMSETFTVTGSHDAPSVNLTLTNATYGTAAFTGTRDGSTITGTLSGLGFTNIPITMFRD